ncbi:MAG: hypothetical protein IJA52_09225 [Clostridia bacterium]|nr:hypothetical protein [Clostridia bacterium]
MKFYTSFCEERPIRLSEDTRRFAYESLYEHKYGLDTKKNPCINLSSTDPIASLSPQKKYDAAIREIAENAPIRICKGEKISCAATLGDAISHWVPFKIDDWHVFLGISHLTINYQKTLDIGINGIRENALSSLFRCHDDNREFLESCISVIDSFKIWIERYVDALNKREGYRNNARNLSKVPFLPAESFYEALQSIWAVFAFCRLCGNWPGIGRIDMLLGDYLKKDLENGILTLSEARELLAHFFIKGCEWVSGGNYVSGDAQHYQNIVLSGCDENGNDITNEVTYLVLDIVEELGISDFPISVRIGKNTPRKLLERVAQVMRHGNGVIAIYNEDIVISALQNNGYTLKEARSFANDGCWEVMPPGKTRFTYIPFDALAILQQKTLGDYSGEVKYESFSELYNHYIADLKDQITAIHKDRVERQKSKDEVVYEWNESVPCTVISLFVDNCIEKGLSYTNGGTEYTVFSPHLGGLADVANSLYAIKKLVWDENKINFSDLMKALDSNWEDAEELRHYALSKLSYYGNDNDEVDIIVREILSDFADICKELEPEADFKFPAGVSTFGRQIGWAKHRYALPSGQKAGSVLANNMDPTPATAFQGATAIINSYCKADFSQISNGAALDIRLLPNDVKGDYGLNALCGLIQGFCELGGFFMQIDVADSAILRDAQENPENYPALSVRIAGWSARFVTLSKEWQDMIIDNIEKNDRA